MVGPREQAVGHRVGTRGPGPGWVLIVMCVELRVLLLPQALETWRRDLL